MPHDDKPLTPAQARQKLQEGSFNMIVCGVPHTPLRHAASYRIHPIIASPLCLRSHTYQACPTVA